MALTAKEWEELYKQAELQAQAKENVYQQLAKQQIANQWKNNNVLEGIAYGAKTGVNQIQSGFESAKLGAQHTVADILGNEEKANELAIALKTAAQQQAQRQAEINAQYDTDFGGVAKFASDVTSGAVGMLPTVGAAVLTPQGKVALAGKAAQVGAKALRALPTIGVMGTQATGLGINQALNEGATVDQAKAYGLGTAVKEVATELPFAGIAKVPGIANVGQKLAGGNKFVGGAINAGLEGAEEAMAEAADPYIQRATYNPNAENASLGDMAYSALIGAATAGAINSSLAGAGKVANMAQNTKKQLKNQQKMANAVQKPQNGSEQVQGSLMTNTLLRPNNGSQNGFIEAEKMRNQLLEEQLQLAKEKSALWQQQQQIKQQDRENAEREMKQAEETLNILKSAKSNAFNDALFNAMDEYTTPEVKQQQPQLSQKELSDAKYKLKKLKEVYTLVKRYNKRGWLSEREYSDLDSAANASLGISGVDARYRFTEYYEEEIAKLEDLISGKKQKADKLEFSLPMAERTLENVKNKNVKAYQQENPEIKPFQQETAEKLLFDLQNGEKGRREVGIDAETRNVTTMHGIKRNQYEPINRMLSDGLTYDKIEDGLNRIIEDNGKENTTNAKRVELYVHDAMKDGYNSITSGRVGANNNYAISKMSAEELKAEADRLSAELATTTDEFRLEEISAQLDNIQNRLDKFEQDRAKQEEQKQLAEAYGSLLPNMSDYESMSAEELHNERDKLESASLYAPDDMSAEMMKRFDYLEKLEDGRVNEFIENENMKPHIANAEKKLAEKKLEFEAPRASEALKANQQKMQELEAKQAANSIFSKVNYNEDGAIDLESSILKTPSTAQRTYADYDLSKLKPEVRDFYEMVNKAGKRFGFNIRVVDGIENDANGRYDGKGNILLDGNKMINEKTISRVIGHEVYHYLKGTDEHKLIIDLSLKGKDKTKEIIKKYNEYASHGVYYVNADGTMDTKALLDEIGAEFMEKILSDPQVAEQIWDTNPTLAERIMRFLQDVINQIRGRATSDVNRKALEAYQRGLRNMQYKQQNAGGTMYSLHDSDKAYMDAVNIGDMETAQRMVDEAAVKAGARHTPSGKPIYFYHGTGADFTVFDEYATVKHGRKLGAGFYLTAKKDLAERYSSGKLMKNYVMTENYAKSGDMNITKDQVRAFISKMERLRHDWYTSDIFDLYKYKEENVDYAEKLADKYDGWPDTSILVDLSKRFAEYNDEDTSYDFSDVAYETFGYKGLLSSGELVLWDNRLIKSADTVTYDDNGNIIPLSQRFDATNPDIRYSLPNTDTAGRELSKEQAEYFKNSKVRDENGNLKVVYHGTSSHGFNVFDYGKSKFGLFGNGFYFTDNESVAESYTQKGNGDSKGVYKVYLNITNPINMDAPANTEWKSIYLDGDDITAYLEISDGKQPTNEDYFKALKNYCQDSGMYRYEAEEYIQDVILGMGFDGITHIGGGRYNKKDETRHRVYIAFEQEQIKDITNKKPTADPDIRYSLPNTDTAGRELSKEQAEYFKNSKVRDENGNLKVMYHGTERGGFTEFISDMSDDGRSFFFTDKPVVAKGYSGTDRGINPAKKLTLEDMQKIVGSSYTKVLYEDGEYKVGNYKSGHGGEIEVEFSSKDYDKFVEYLWDMYGDYNADGISGNYEVYLNLENPLVVDADGKSWDGLDVPAGAFDGKGWATEGEWDTRMYAEFAYYRGYDGVIFNNLVDTAIYASSSEKYESSTVAVAFHPEQIKDVYNEKPTSNSDIRYALPADDNANVDIANKSGEVVAEQRGTEVRFNLGSYENGGSDVLQKYVDDMVKKNKIDADYGKAVVDQLETMYKTIKKLTTGDSAEKYSYFTAWSEVMPEFTDDGELVLSVATPNGEYPMNLDFSTRCAKRVAIDTLLMHMSASGIYDIAELTPGDFAMINQILKDHNLATACTMCFVETKRDKSASWASTIADEYNELLEAANIQNGVIDEASLSAKRKEMAEREEKATSMAMSERYAKYLRANAQNPIQLKASDLMHSEGMEKIKREAPDIFSIASSRYGAGTPKPLTAEGAYANEMIRPDLKRKGGKKKNPFTWKPEDAFKVGGVRLQSFSDFRVEMFFDYCQMIAEASLKGLPVQSYTKVPAFAKLFGMTGIKINMSLVPEVELTAEERTYIDSLTDKQKKTDARFKEIQSRAGLSRKGRYLWAKESFDPELAYKLQNDDKYTNNVGTVAIGVSDAQIWQMLKDKNIRMIIPYHKSSIDAVVARAKNIDVFKNYESCQNHLVIDPSLPMLPNETYAQYYRRLVNVDKYGSKTTKKVFNFDFYGALKKENDPVKVSKKYVDECQKRNIAPKFPQFVYNQDGSFNENYYKMLIDFAVYNKNGEYTPQQAVKFDNEHLPRNWFETLKKELAIDEADRKRMDAEIAGVAEEVVARLKTEERYSFGDLVDKYGAIPKGENPNGTNRDIDVPQQTADDNRVSRFARTAVESSNVDDTSVSMVMADMENGRFTYEPSGNREQIDRANGLINHTGWERQLEQFQNKYRSGQAMTADDIVLGERLIQEAQSHGDYNTAVDLIADIAAIGTELGRAVQALSVLKRLTPQGKVQALKRVEDRINAGLVEQGKKPVEIPNQLLEEMLQAESAQMQSDIWDECIQEMANQVPATLVDKINAWRYLAMLSNPKTHIRNILGNSVMRGVSAVKRGIQTSLENRLLTAGEERYTELNRNVPKEYFDFAEISWQNEGKKRAEASGGRYNDAIGQVERNKRIFNTELLEKWRKGNENALFGEDMMFKKPAYINALARYMHANGLAPSELQSVASNASYEKGVAFALKEADKATFQEASKVANLLSRMEHSSPAAKVIMGALVPFKKTPINILKRGVEYSPVGLMNGLYKMRHDVQTGKMTKAEAIDAISAGLTGTGIMVLGYFMASMGMITAGAGEDDERKQWYDQQMGSQNFALVLPNGATATIDWLAPSVMPLMAGAELYKQMVSENSENANSSAVTNTLEAISKVANPVLEMSMLQGVTGALQSYNSGTTGVLSDLLTSTATSYGGQFIPAPVGALARTVDDTVRSSYAPKDSMLTKTGEKFVRQQMNKLPFVSMLNNPSVDVWGNEVERAGGNIVGRAFNNFINPSTYSADKKTALDNELDKLYKATGNSGVLPSSGTNYIAESKSNPKIQLSSDEYMQYGTTKGQKSHQYVSAFVNSYAYSQLPDEDKAKIVSNLYSLANYQAKKEALNGRGYDYSDSEYDKVLKSKMEPQNYYIVKYEMDMIADKVTTGQKSQQIAYLQGLQQSGIITDEQCWYLRRAIIGKFSKAELASCPYAWIKNL